MLPFFTLWSHTFPFSLSFVFPPLFFSLYFSSLFSPQNSQKPRDHFNLEQPQTWPTVRYATVAVHLLHGPVLSFGNPLPSTAACYPSLENTAAQGQREKSHRKTWEIHRHKNVAQPNRSHHSSVVGIQCVWHLPTNIAFSANRARWQLTERWATASAGLGPSLDAWRHCIRCAGDTQQYRVPYCSPVSGAGFIVSVCHLSACIHQNTGQLRGIFHNRMGVR